MSDFVYSSIIKPQSQLTHYLESIYPGKKTTIVEFHGNWGSLAVSRNNYYGLEQLETKQHILVIIGGPVLTFTSNDFLTGDNPTAGTRKIYNKWLSGSLKWGEDLDGPFTMLVVDKTNCRVTCITDMMMYIPVYKYISRSALILGTHIDACARGASLENAVDLVSAVDFILNDEITYPYTLYKDIRQCNPATIHDFYINKESIAENKKVYWLPVEENRFKTINDAAAELRTGLQNHVSRIAAGMNNIAQFISGGEDSRAIAGLLPEKAERDAIIFLNLMNREGYIAQKAASAYGAHFKVGYRTPSYYLDILPEATTLVGGGHQYTHAHSLGFIDNFTLNSYQAVFGGFFSDALLKAGSRKSWWNTRYFFLPQFSIIEESKRDLNKYPLFKDDITSEVNHRRRTYMNTVKSIRPTSAYDWFEFWPATMCDAITSHYCNRRLFRSYEPFMCNTVARVGAAVPLKWKLNRSLFQKAMKPMLKKSRWIVHADGRLPYYSWKVNFFIGGFNWAVSGLYRRLKKIDLVKEGPWGNLQDVISDPKWNTITDVYKDTAATFAALVSTADHTSFYNSSSLKVIQRINTVQMLHTLHNLSGEIHNDN
jgi:hypothetical protein